MEKAEVRTRAISTYMFDSGAGYSVSLPPVPAQASNVFKKVRSDEECSDERSELRRRRCS